MLLYAWAFQYCTNMYILRPSASFVLEHFLARKKRTKFWQKCRWLYSVSNHFAGMEPIHLIHPNGYFSFVFFGRFLLQWRRQTTHRSQRLNRHSYSIISIQQIHSQYNNFFQGYTPVRPLNLSGTFVYGRPLVAAAVPRPPAEKFLGSARSIDMKKVRPVHDFRALVICHIF